MWPSGKAPVFGIGIAGSNPATPAIIIMNKEAIISLQDCTFSYLKIPILKDINLSVHSFDKIALIGKNGVGKSTLMEILSKERTPGSGEIWFHPRISIEFLKQKNFFENSITVYEYLSNEIKKKILIICNLKIQNTKLI